MASTHALACTSTTRPQPPASGVQEEEEETRTVSSIRSHLPLLICSRTPHGEASCAVLVAVKRIPGVQERREETMVMMPQHSLVFRRIQSSAAAAAVVSRDGTGERGREAAVRFGAWASRIRVAAREQGVRERTGRGGRRGVRSGMELERRRAHQ
jgi:hypothetical protein